MKTIRSIIMSKYVSLRLFVDKDDRIRFRTYERDGSLYYINDTNEIEIMLNKDELNKFEPMVRKIAVENNWREIGSRVVDVSNLFVSNNKKCSLLSH